MTISHAINREDKTATLDSARNLVEQTKAEAALDDALRGTFPASDPVSIQTIYRPVRRAILLTKPDKES